MAPRVAPDENHICELLRSGQSRRAVAQQTGWALSTIKRIARDHGLRIDPASRSPSNVEKNRMCKLFTNGESFAAIAQATGWCKDTVRKILGEPGRGLIERRLCANPDCFCRFPVRRSSKQRYCLGCRPTPEEIRERAAAVRATWMRAKRREVYEVEEVTNADE